MGSDTSLAKLVNLIESVQSQKPSIQRLADKIAGKFTYFVLFASISSFIFWWQIAFRIWPNLINTENIGLSIHNNHSLHSYLGSNADNPLTLAIQLSIAVLVIACPCALGLATPTVITVASGKAAKKGILFKGGDKIEIASKIDSIIFDKTGTLTKGSPYVIGYVGSKDDTFLLQISASLENESRHPIAKSLIQEAKKQNINLLPIKNINTETGRGISGELFSINGEIKVGNLQWLENHNVEISDEIKDKINTTELKKYTIIGVSISTNLIGCILLGDTLRDDALSSIKKLREDNLDIYIFSGDRKESVIDLGRKLNFNIKELKWELLPEDKLKNIEKLKNSDNYKVAMVGDGINDAPALAASNLGIAVGSGTQIAKANADLVLMGDKLNGLHYALKLAKKTIRKIKQNLFWAFGYNLIAIPLAAGVLYPKFGILLSPSIAALLMAISSITVVINALSLD